MPGIRLANALAMAGILLLGSCTTQDGAAPPVAGATTTAGVAIDAQTTGRATSSTPAASSIDTALDSTLPPISPSVRTGSGALLDEGFNSLKGKRVGLIAHEASVVDGQRLADAIHADPDVVLAALYAPEHGLFGLADAGEAVGDQVDPETGAPVFSLYGAIRAPTPESLAAIDVLLYDLQDVGTRFYTYISTMGLAMQAAAEAGVEFIVLDRPNPLGGDTLQGPILGDGLTSFIGQYPIPSAYGLTAGELAQMIHGQSLLPGLVDLELTVLPVSNWARAQRWEDLTLEWIPPSPNLLTPDAALLYPGTVLFEATTLNEGRGTPEPFQTIGAAWLDGPVLAGEMNALGLAGVQFEAATFVPDGTTEELHGVQITVIDAVAVRGLEVGLQLMAAVLRQARQIGIGGVIDRPDVFDRLAGSPDVRAALVEGTPVEDILARFETDHERFRGLAEPYLLYN